MQWAFGSWHGDSARSTVACSYVTCMPCVFATRHAKACRCMHHACRNSPWHAAAGPCPAAAGRAMYKLCHAMPCHAMSYIPAAHLTRAGHATPVLRVFVLPQRNVCVRVPGPPSGNHAGGVPPMLASRPRMLWSCCTPAAACAASHTLAAHRHLERTVCVLQYVSHFQNFVCAARLRFWPLLLWHPTGCAEPGGQHWALLPAHQPMVSACLEVMRHGCWGSRHGMLQGWITNVPTSRLLACPNCRACPELHATACSSARPSAAGAPTSCRFRCSACCWLWGCGAQWPTALVSCNAFVKRLRMMHV